MVNNNGRTTTRNASIANRCYLLAIEGQIVLSVAVENMIKRV